MSRKRCWKPHEKILLLAQVTIFQKLVFVCNYIRRKTSNGCSSKHTLCTFLREPLIQTCWNLVHVFLGWFLTNLIGHSRGQKRSQNPIWPPFWLFWPLKWSKIKIFKIPKSDLSETILRTRVLNFSMFGWVVLSRRYIKSVFRYGRFKFFRLLFSIK